MKIGFLHGKENDMTLQMGNQLRDSLSPHEVLLWPEGETPPCEDLDVLLVSGAVTSVQLESQPKLGLIKRPAQVMEQSIWRLLIGWAYGFRTRHPT